MLHHTFAHPWMLWLLLALPLLAVLEVWNAWRRRRMLARWGNTAALETRTVAPAAWRWLRRLGLLLALLALGVGMAGPRWGRDWNQATAPGRDLVVVLDCSRSMLAETPSRLQRARAALIDLADTIEKQGGHRLALILCAGKTKLACPLTHDYDHFRSKLEVLEDIAQQHGLEPGPAAPSGTRLGQALTLAAAGQESRFPNARDILLLSDGDDPARDGEWKQGAQTAAAVGVRVHAIGIGDPHADSVIRLDSGVLTHDGQPVHTRLQETPLRAIAELTGGVYTSARTRTVPLGALYLDAVRNESLREDREDVLPVYRLRYAWFLAPALALLTLLAIWD